MRDATVTMPAGGAFMCSANADFSALLDEPLLERVDRASAREPGTGSAQWIDGRLPAGFAKGLATVPADAIGPAAASG